MLTKNQIEAASKDRNHLVIKTLDSFGDNYWSRLVEEARAKPSQQEGCMKYYEGFIPFAKNINGQKFTLNPLEIISVWSRATELFPIQQHAKYALSTAIACTYGIYPIKSDELMGLYESIATRNYKKAGEIVKESETERERFRGRLREIKNSLEKINTNETLSDKEVNILAAISENWANGCLMPLELISSS